MYFVAINQALISFTRLAKGKFKLRKKLRITSKYGWQRGRGGVKFLTIKVKARFFFNLGSSF